MITATVSLHRSEALSTTRIPDKRPAHVAAPEPKRLSTRDTRGYSDTDMTNMNTEHSLLAEHQHRPSCSPCRRARPLPARPAVLTCTERCRGPTDPSLARLAVTLRAHRHDL